MNRSIYYNCLCMFDKRETKFVLKMEEVLMGLISLWMGIVAEEQQLKAVCMYKQAFEKIHFQCICISIIKKFKQMGSN